MATKNRAPKKSTIAVDFSETETQAALEEGDYLIEVEDVEKKVSDSSGADYLSITFKVADGPFKGKKVYHNCSLQPQALFNLRGVLEALGFDVPQGVMELDPADMVGEQCGASIAHETYQGKTKARPVEFFAAEDLAGDEAPAKPAAATKVVKPAAKAAKPAPVEADEDETPAPKTRTKKKVAEPELKVGSSVSFTDDEGDDQVGVIKAIEDDTYTVTTGRGKNAEDWELELSDLTAV